MTLSVIVPVYNVEKYLNRCIGSILAQDFSDYELILVDDGSTDSSGELCDCFAARHQDIKVIHKPNGGLSSARNAGIQLASGKYLAFIDSDDSIEPGMFSDIMACFAKSQVSIVCFGYSDVYTDKTVAGNNASTEEVVSFAEANKRMFIGDGVVVSVCTKVYLASLFNGIRFPEGLINEDIYVMSELLHAAGMVYICPRVYYNYHHRDNSITTKRFDKSSFDYIIATKHSAEFISRNEQQNEFLARAALYESICVVGRTYLYQEMAVQQKCRAEFHKYVLDEIDVNYRWFQNIVMDASDTSAIYCVRHYLNMYAVLLDAWHKNSNCSEARNLRKQLRKELKRLSNMSDSSLFKTPYLYYQAYPRLTCIYRVLRTCLRKFI